MTTADPSTYVGLVAACVDLIGRAGAKEFQLRYDEKQQPVVWVAVARWSVMTPSGIPSQAYKATGGLTPDEAATRLAEAAVDGGICAHCGRYSGVDVDWAAERPNARLIGGPDVCWYVYDPELNRFRRDCEDR